MTSNQRKLKVLLLFAKQIKISKIIQRRQQAKQHFHIDLQRFPLNDNPTRP